MSLRSIRTPLPLMMIALLALLVSGAPRAATAAGRVTLRLESERPLLTQVERDGRVFATFESPHHLSDLEGAPALPTVSRLVGVPSLEAPSIESNLASAVSLGVAAQPIAPAPSYRPIETEDPLAPPPGVAATYPTDREIYASDAWYPAEPVTVSKPMMLRGQAVVRVTFTPVQIRPATGEMRWVPSADVTLDWAGTELLASRPMPAPDPAFDTLFDTALANPEQARPWRQQPAGGEAAPTATSTNHAWRIELEGQGLFRIPYSQLQAAGVPLGAQPQLAIYHLDGQIATEQAVWFDDTTQNLYLLNTREPGYWSRRVVYEIRRLTVGSGARMATSASAPTQPATVTRIPFTLRFEEDLIYNSGDWALDSSEAWFWRLFGLPINSPQVLHFETTFDLPQRAAGSGAAVDAELARFQEPFERCADVTATVNGSYTAQRTGWETFDGFDTTVNVPSGGVSATGNLYELDLSTCGNGLLLNLNAITVKYDRNLVLDGPELIFDSDRASAANFRISNTGGADVLAFELGNPDTPRRLTGGSYAVPNYTFGRAAPSGERYLVTRRALARSVAAVSAVPTTGLRSDSAGSDYIVITPAAFESAIQPLVQHRRTQGHVVRVARLSDVYHEFGNGQPDPDAIRAFLQHAYRNWNPSGPPPAYVLLVGDGTYDPFDILGEGDPVWIPPNLVIEDIYLGRVPSDNAYVSALDPLDPQGDPLPDMHIGRLPVNSVADVNAVVSKLIAYDTTAPDGGWQRSILMLSDNNLPDGPDPDLDPDPDPAGDFYALSDRLFELSFFPHGRVNATTAYLPPTDTRADALELRDRILTQYEKGNVIVQYIGHAGRTRWAANPGIWTTERFDINQGFVSDLSLLSPTDRPPVSLAWTCWEGYHVTPGLPSVGEEMVIHPTSGAVASFSPVGLDVATAHDRMTEGFYEALFEHGETVMGPLTYASKLQVSGNNLDRLIYTYLLFGDPAMNIRIAPCAIDPNVSCPSNLLYVPSLTR